MTIARRFNAGAMSNGEQVLKGRLKYDSLVSVFFNRPFGATICHAILEYPKGLSDPRFQNCQKDNTLILDSSHLMHLAKRNCVRFWEILVSLFVVALFLTRPEFGGYAGDLTQTSPSTSVDELVSADIDLPRLSPGETVRSLQASKLIVNAHEHIQSMEEAPKLLRAMDKYGIAKTVLMGSSWFTITLNWLVGFTRYAWNNEELIKIVNAYPGRFEAWPTVNPHDPNNVERIKDFVARGATGIKLYLGHGYTISNNGNYLFHTMAMDDPRMLPLYGFCEKNFVPICYHVNPFKPGFAEEFIAVLSQFPDLKIIAPHFILSSIKDSRLREFLDTFPNLYSDISFGHDTFLHDGLVRISKNPEKFRGLFTRYSDRFVFGSDLVITEIDFKNETWMGARLQAYYDMLSKERYTTPLVPGKTLLGLALSQEILEGILYNNYIVFMERKLQGTQISREIDWTNMGVKRTGRKPGTIFMSPGN